MTISPMIEPELFFDQEMNELEIRDVLISGRTLLRRLPWPQFTIVEPLSIPQ